MYRTRHPPSVGESPPAFLPVRVPLLTLGSRGDVQPSAQLARVLLDRGHDVVLGAPPNFAAVAAALDVPSAPIAHDFEALTQGP